jgi:predicted anti-sigma-YlaC factor YlaD
VSEDGGVDCEVAREALSARIDGEREPVPSARVDEHLRSCAPCRSWYSSARDQAAQLRRVACGGFASLARINAPVPSRHAHGRYAAWCRMHWPRSALALVGLIQIALAVAQAIGLDFGMVARRHGAMTGAHLLNESTAWSVALGAMMIAAALRPVAASGLAGVLCMFVVVLAGYVIADSISGQVTALRVVSHLPVLAGTMLALLVWRRQRPERPSPQARTRRNEGDIMLPHNAARRRRRGHLQSSDDSAA